MRLLDLRLLRFGPFTDAVLDLAEPAEALHLVYGPNEAGKSTALRAVTGLLYGIPATTPDAHHHAPKDLRVGARLAGADGRAVTVVRRKGTRNTLLDEQGQALDDDVLTRLLGGVGEDLYRTLYGLDHRTLAAGAQALIEGKGHVGESLFAAAVGGRALSETLAELRQEAEAIFAPRAQKPRLNEALKALAEQQRKARDAPLAPEAWSAQERAIAETKDELERATRDVRALESDKARLRRLEKALPHVGRRARLLEQLAALGEVKRLPSDAPRRREDALREAREAALHEERLGRELAEREARRAALVVPESLVLAHELVDDVAARLGAHRKAGLELPRVRGEIERLEDDARAILRRLRPDLDLAGAEALRLDAATQARMRKLAQEAAKHDAGQEHAARAVGDAAGKLDEAQRELEGLPPERDAAALRRAVTRAQRQGDLDARLRKARADARRIDEATRARLGALGLAGLEPAAAEALALPTLATALRFEKELAGAATRRERQEERKAAAERALADLEREVGEVRKAGPVPSEDELAARRAERDAQWQAIRLATSGGAPLAATEANGYERAVRDADELADRLRSEAERVARLAQLVADRAARERERAEAEAELAAVAAREGELAAEWARAWAPAGVSPRAPAEMRGWLERHAAAVKGVALLRAAEAEADEVAALVEEHRAELDAALLALGEPAAGDASLAALLERGEATARAVEDAARRRRELARTRDAAGREHARAAADRAELESVRAAWRVEWSKAVLPLGLGPEPSTEEVDAVLGALEKLFQKVDEAERARRRAAAMEADAERFRAEVLALAREHAPDLASADVERAAGELVRRSQQARTDLATRSALDRELAEKRAEQGAQAARGALARARLDELCAAAGAADVAALELAERRSAEALELEAALRHAEDKILDAGGDGATVKALVAETRDVDADALAAELEDVEARAEQSARRRDELHRRLGEQELGLRNLESRSPAADSAAEVQERLSRVRTEAERWIRVRLAAAVLAREIERYREANQGPILRRASELYRRLTLGGFSGLRTGWGANDQAVLRCVREGGEEVDVTGLSDGARDQLYLALRLATLERQAQAADPLPLVLDDVLVQFDDDRARAALAVLGEIAALTQILFFTHHARLLDLAREAVPEARLRVHRLR